MNRKFKLTAFIWNIIFCNIIHVFNCLSWFIFNASLLMNVCVNVCMRCEHRFLCIYWRFLTNWYPVCAIYFFFRQPFEDEWWAFPHCSGLSETSALFSFMWVGGCGSLAKWDFIPLSAARHFSFSLTGDSRLCQTILLRKHLQSVYINTNRK